jgi:hypothetical protein
MRVVVTVLVVLAFTTNTAAADEGGSTPDAPYDPGFAESC